MTDTDYETQAQDFLKETGTVLCKKQIGHDLYFEGDTEPRDIWQMTLRREGKVFRFRFGQSIAGVGTVPTAYDVLACLTKYDPQTFEDFCSEYGYDSDSRTAEKTYKAVKKEWQGISKLFNEAELDKLREIQ